MEEHIFLLNRLFPSKVSRTRVEGIRLNGKVLELKSAASKMIKVSTGDIELLYRGVILKDDELLSTYNIKSGVVVHALRKVEPPENKAPEKLSKGEVRDIVKALQNALVNPAYRNTVEQMLSNPETLENLIATTPSLDRDPVAIAMLQDIDLLAILADPKTIDKVIDKHPGLAQAAMFVTSALREQSIQGASPGGRRRTGSSGHYSLDRMSDDEEEMDTSQGQQITANQLASALAAATGQPLPSSSSAGGGGGRNNEAAAEGSSGISADFVRHALQQALGGAPQQQPVTESNLQQLREMGITDENVARQALIAAGGDIQGALEIIFGEGL